MKKKERKSLREKTTSQLESELVSCWKKLIGARVKLAKRQLKNTRLLAQLRTKIAFIKTIIRERELVEEAKNEE